MTESIPFVGNPTLKPRKVSATSNVDNFLEGIGLTEHTDPKEGSRPALGTINAARCCVCDQLEYLSREYCRCGHYLRGQIEDEYLNWENNLADQHRKSAVIAERKLKPFRISSAILLLTALSPTAYSVFKHGSASFWSFSWLLLGLAIVGIFSLFEKSITSERDNAAEMLNMASFDLFLHDRITFNQD